MKKIFFVNLHSHVDVITNSSTVIYSWTRSDAVEQLKSMVNELLQLAGAKKDFDDIFEVQKRWQNTDYAAERMYDPEYDNGESYPEFKEYFKLQKQANEIYDSIAESAWRDPAYIEAQKAAQMKFDEILYSLPYEEQRNIMDDGDNYLQDDLVLIVKDSGIEKSVLEMFINIFEQDGTFN